MENVQTPSGYPGPGRIMTSYLINDVIQRVRQFDIREKYYFDNNMYINTHKHMLIKYNFITEI